MPSGLAQLLRSWRERALLTQQELAERCGLGVRTVRRLETGGHRPHAASVRLLADALGLSGEERQILTATAKQARTVPVEQGGPPRQLPPAAAHFVGRREQIRGLADLMRRTMTSTAVAVIAGGGGIGKTTLAVQFAHQVADRFRDGQLYLNLRGYHPSGTPVAAEPAIRHVLDALGVPPQRIPADSQAQVALYRTVLAGKHVLLLLDNAHSCEQVRPLLPTTPGCLALITSRDELTGLIASDGAHHITLGVLSRDESRRLLASRLGQDRLTADAAATGELISHCAGVPLALTIIAARAATRLRFPLSVFASELSDAHSRLDALDTGDPNTQLRSVFSWSYTSLPKAAAKLFRLLSLHPGPDMTVSSMASLAGISLSRVRTALATLTQNHLVEEHTPARYGFHDLLRAYAAEQNMRCETGKQRQETIMRVLDHYLHAADAAAEAAFPQRDPRPPSMALSPPRRGVTPEDIHDDPARALDWFAAESAVLVAVTRTAASVGAHRHTWQLVITTYLPLRHRGHWRELSDLQDAALLAAQQLGDLPAQAAILRRQGDIHARLGHHGKAEAILHDVLDLYHRLDDPLGQARAFMELVRLAEAQNRYPDALERARHALKHFRAAGNRRDEATALNAVGWCLLLLGDYETALATCRESLAQMQDLGAVAHQADVWDSIGYAQYHLGRYADAIDSLGRAVELYGDHGDRYAKGLTLARLADAYDAKGDDGQAATAARTAITVFEAMGHPEAQRLRRKYRRSLK
ncbi:MAG TPA: tetratricopeptide repeat protein [Candidatus Limnocylindrales bacterium]|nr:tetratricopeptide repeat protein [Candidatus Limnocylindrales bacterium]